MAKKVLVVEDDRFLRELMSKKLAGSDFVVCQAFNGEQGVSIAKSEKPDIILLDLILPGIDGFEALSRIKQDPETSAIPVIVLSNLGQKEGIERGMKLGAADYLIKAHFSPGEIIDKIIGILK